MAKKEHFTMKPWLKRRGLSYEEVFHGVFPAIKAAAHNFDPEHNSGASFSTFAMGYIKGEVAGIVKKWPPEVSVGEYSAHRVPNTEEFSRAHGRGGAGELLRGHPKMTSYEIAMERGPEVRGAG